MNYIIFDLEFNQDYNPKKKKSKTVNKDCPFEIIQVGAVKLDENLSIIATMDRLVKPEVYKELNPFVKDLTGLTIDELNLAKPFNEIYEEFVQLVKDDRNILCVWGMADIKELVRNIKYYNLDTSPIPKEYINVQQCASKYLKLQKGINIGLSNAVDALNIPFMNEFHDAFSDAYYTAEIFKKIFNPKIQPKSYNHERHKKSSSFTKENKELDTAALINQFEKMFQREMSEEEKSIITLAYIMGRTNQFQIDSSEK